LHHLSCFLLLSVWRFELAGSKLRGLGNCAHRIDEAMATARFRFYQELNDFLAPELRGREFSCWRARPTTVKQVIESLGVPHTEVELVLVNGESVGFERLLQDGDRVSVYPEFEAFDVTPLVRVRDGTLRNARVIADWHLMQLLRRIGVRG
jgi:hypothetical protein